ncbi:MAG: transglycosylase domain-containing protein [Minisyncoccia bacterium]
MEKINNLFKKIFFILLSIILISGLSLILLARHLPDPKDFNERSIAQSTKIYDRTGQVLLYDIHGEERRTVIPLKDVSPHIIKSLLAAEDHTFYSHHGFVFKSFARAFINVIIKHQKIQGTSTLTQQLARNAFLTSQRSIIRKLKEAILTIQIERHYTKDQILEMYLNQIPWGNNNYGVETASEYYFNKPAKDIDLAEAAYLVSLIQAPNYLSPYGSHVSELEERKNYVLQRLLTLGWYSLEDINKAKQEKVNFATPSFGFKAPHFVMYVKDLLSDMFTEDELMQGGYTIITTLDMNLQTIAEETVKKYGDYNEKHIGSKNLGLLAEDPKTGQILAMVGSRDYWNTKAEGNVNFVLSVRQPGSSFKPIVYAAAFKKGLLPESVVFDTALDGIHANFSTDPDHLYLVTNYDNTTRGPVTLRQALAQSLNIPSVKVLYLVGVDNAIKLAKDLGITTLTQPPNYYGLSLVLGGGGVKLIEMVHAYSVFPNEGVIHPQTAILKIIDKNNNIIKDFSLQTKQVLDPQITRMITDILSDNVSRTPAFGANSPLYFPNYDVAVKTGTDNEYRDAWTIGYTTELVAGVIAGNNDRSPVVKPGGAPASMVAAPCWHEFMEKAFKYYPPQHFTKPLPYDISKINKPMVNGQYIISRTYKNIKTGELKTIKEIHSILYYVNRDDILGPMPTNPYNDPQFILWEMPVILWAQKNIPNFNNEYNLNLGPDYILIDNQNPDTVTFPDVPNIDFIYPQNGDFINNNFTVNVKITSPIGIKNVVIYLNNELLGNLIYANNDTYYFNLPLEKIQNQNKLKIEATDNLDQTNTQTIIFYH